MSATEVMDYQLAWWLQQIRNTRMKNATIVKNTYYILASLSSLSGN